MDVRIKEGRKSFNPRNRNRRKENQ